MPEPSKEELMARIAELENQVGSKKQGSLEFKVGGKGGVSVYGTGPLPGDTLLRAVGAPARRSRWTPRLSGRKQEQAEIEKQSISSSMDWCRQVLVSRVEPGLRKGARSPCAQTASQHGLPFIASHPSCTISGNRTKAATGSAQLTLQIALTTRPAKAIRAR